jgi:hypothetical protein
MLSRCYIAITYSIDGDVKGWSVMQSDLSQAEADALLRMEKFCVDATPHAFPDFGGRIQIALQSQNQRESFSLDISRKRIALTTKYQTRGRQTVVLARLNFNSPHRNPDDTEVGIPHLHIYREGFGDRWAYEVPTSMLKNSSDAWQVLLDFMAYCSIVEQPNISRGLFS